MVTEKKSCCGAEKAASMRPEEIKAYIRERYGALVQSPGASSCSCSDSLPLDAKVALSAGYTDEQLAQVPEHAAEHSFGCGNPVALAGIMPGQTVLDIGSGAGIDVLLAAAKVGPTGRVIGLDMTPAMIEAAEKNAASVGATNVEFRLGDAEEMPVESDSVDWIISNCVINLAPDKAKVFGEAYRVMRSGGKLLLSDIVAHDLPQEVRESARALLGCVAGAIDQESYLRAIRNAGLTDVQVVARLDYDEDAIKGLIGSSELSDCLNGFEGSLAGKVATIKVSATKP